ncbi:hypothetical protein Syun_017156 [Stephania yunnanensis]|uniref:HSF-type DNA-binding domain-containing protein n=1 Tax=Stephania yunnanensis TaxID=152371 RepID=A0AAP0J6J4_9MAGN
MKTIKEEEQENDVDDDDDEVVFMGSASSYSSSSSSMARPMERIHEMGPPPFLTKTFEMVDDPLTDAIVSWNKARNSFIVWDSYRLASNLLPHRRRARKRLNATTSSWRRGAVTEDEDDGGKNVQRSEEDGEQ